MSLADLLPIYAELAVAFAGFVGVVSAFTGRDRSFRPVERARFMYVVLCSASVLAGCLTYFTAVGGGAEHDLGVRLAAAASLVATGLVGLETVPGAWRHANDPDSTTESWSLYLATGSLFLEGGLFSAAILVGNASVALLAGFSLQLVMALWMFVRLLTRAN